MVRGSALVVVGMVLAGAATPAAADTSRRFDGRSRGGAPVVLRLTSTRAVSYDLRVHGRCSDGTRFASGLVGGGAGIGSDGTFSVSVAGRRGSYGRRHGAYDLVLKAQRRGDAVRGTVRVSFRSGRFSCSSGSAPFLAHRDGTPGAPLRDADAATGRYAAGGSGLGGLNLRVFLPARQVESVSFSWRVRCRRGAVLTGRERLGPLALGAGGRFGIAGRDAARLAAGRSSHEAYRLTGRLFRAGGIYRVSGMWVLRSAIVRRGRIVNRCATRGLRFSGRLAGE